MSSAREAGLQAQAADVRRLVLTHLPPGADSTAAQAAAAAEYGGLIEVATAGLVVDVP